MTYALANLLESLEFRNGDGEEILMLPARFNEAIVGLTEIDLVNDSARLVYDRYEVLKVYMDQDGMSWEDAEEFFQYNVVGAFVGNGQPLFVDTV